MRSNILIVDPNADIRRTAKEILEADEHKITESESLDRWLTGSSGQGIDLIFLSWLGNARTRHQLAKIRDHHSTRESQVIITATDSDMREALSTLDSGADDCVRVPFFEPEFRARVSACLRRKNQTAEQQRLIAGPIVLDKIVHQLYIDDHKVDLAPTEYRLIAFFLENQNRVFSRRELLRGAWTNNSSAGQRTVDVHVRRLRRVLEPFGYDQVIQTVRSFGYRFSLAAAAASTSANSMKSRTEPTRRAASN